jgi:hypothetical protein
VFVSLDPSAGSAKVQAELKRVYELTTPAKRDAFEQIAEVTLSRPGPRTAWQIDTMSFKPK